MSNSSEGTHVKGVDSTPGFKGGSPLSAVNGVPGNVAGPISGSKVTGSPVSFAVSESSRSPHYGRPRSGKIKVTVAVSEPVANLLKEIPAGTRGQTVERALRLVFDGPGVVGMEQLVSELAPLSVRLQQVLELLANHSPISEETRIKAAAQGASIINLAHKLLLP